MRNGSARTDAWICALVAASLVPLARLELPRCGISGEMGERGTAASWACDGRAGREGADQTDHGDAFHRGLLGRVDAGVRAEPGKRTGIRQNDRVRCTFTGHVGFLFETRGGSVLCDPWFTPAYFGSWFPFPRNDTLAVEPFATPDYLYISHLHRDHFDPEWLAANVDKRATVLLPDFKVPFLERELRDLGFERFVHTSNGEPVDLDGLEVTILAFTEPADGPLGDSLLVLDDGTARVLNQNDARPGDPDALRALGPFDAQIVQYSGAIWYPVVYDFPQEMKDQLARNKRENEMARARQYIEWVDAAHVFPCAGPPAFLDDTLFDLNDFDRDAANIFPDQTVFLELLRASGIDRGELIVPGSVVDLAAGEC